MKEKTSGLVVSENSNNNNTLNDNTESEWKTKYSYKFFSEAPFVIFILIFATYPFFFN